MKSKINPKDIIPIGPYMLIELEKVEDITAGGILLPDKLKDQQDLASTTAKILAMGHECYLEYEKETPVPEDGDMVITARYAGLKIDTENGNHKICKDEDVVAVIRSK